MLKYKGKDFNSLSNTGVGSRYCGYFVITGESFFLFLHKNMATPNEYPQLMFMEGRTK